MLNIIYPMTSLIILTSEGSGNTHPQETA